MCQKERMFVKIYVINAVNEKGQDGENVIDICIVMSCEVSYL